LDPRLLDEGPRPKSGKTRLNLHGTILEGNSIGSNPKENGKLKKNKNKTLKGKAHDLENQDVRSYGPRPKKVANQG